MIAIPARQPTRTFHSPRQALLWYRDQLASRLRCTRDLEGVSVRLSAEARERRDATFAKLANCLRRDHPADVEPESAQWLMSGERVAWLLASYEARWGDNTWLADRANLTRWTFTRLCRRTERVLRRRLDFAGLLDAP